MNQHVKHISLAATFVVATLGQIDSASSRGGSYTNPLATAQTLNAPPVSGSTEVTFLPHKGLTSSTSMKYSMEPSACRSSKAEKSSVTRAQFCMFSRENPNYTAKYIEARLKEVEALSLNQTTKKWTGRLWISKDLLREICQNDTNTFKKSLQRSAGNKDLLCSLSKDRGLRN